MKTFTNFITSIITAAFLFVSCQNPAGGNTGDDSVNPPEDTKKEYTVSFDTNCPSMNGTIWYSCSDYAPDSITAKEYEYVTLPAFSGELTKYKGSDEEGVYAFEKWNTAADGSGDSYVAGASYQVNGNMTFYAVYSEEKNPDGNDEDNENEALDFSATTTFSMKMGESVQLVNEIGNYEVYYEIQSGSDVVELGSGSLKAIGPGSTIVVAKDWNGSSKTWSCNITVTVEGFTGSALEYKLIGRWEDGNSYLVLNADKSGELKVYDNGSLLQESTFNWSSYEDSLGMHLAFTNCSAEYIEKKSPYTITSISVTTLRLHGYLAFKSAENTTWTKR